MKKLLGIITNKTDSVFIFLTYENQASIGQSSGQEVLRKTADVKVFWKSGERFK